VTIGESGYDEPRKSDSFKGRIRWDNLLDEESKEA